MLTRNKIGVAFSNLSSSEATFFLTLAASELHNKMDVILFYETHERPCLPLPCASMQFNEVWSFRGPVVATNLGTAHKLLQASSPTERYLYCQDLEWTRFPFKNYHELASIYRNPKIKLIAKTLDHKIMIEDCWNVKINLICETFKEVLLNEQICQKTFEEIPFLVYGRRKKLPARPLY